MRNVYDFYITPEEYKLATENGIGKVALENRIRKLGWDKERALTQPTQKKIDNSKWYPIAEANGISRKLFLSRINKNKWSPEKAATEPVRYTSERNRKYSDEIYEILEVNGISKELFYDRMRKGWSVERAMTEKKFTVEEVTKKMLEASKYINSGFKELHKVDWLVRSNNSISG